MLQLIGNLIVNGLVEGLITSMIALSVVASYAITRFPNAAVGDYAVTGAYTAYMMMAKLSLGLGIAALAGVGVVAMLSLAFYLLVFRRLQGRGYVAPLLASIGLAFLTRNVLALAVGHDPIVLPVPLMRAYNLGGVFIQPADLGIAGVSLVVLLMLSVLMYRTPIGREMRAIADDRDLAQLSGIRIDRVLRIVWLVAGATAGLGGTFLAMKSVMQPETGWYVLLAGFAGAILGGLTSFPGAVVGSLLLCVAQEVSGLVVGSSYKLATPFVVILLVLLFRPSGLYGRPLAVR